MLILAGEREVKREGKSLLTKGLVAEPATTDALAESNAPYFGAELDEGSLVPADDDDLGKACFEDWLARS
ncbi:hypothetical protein GCM10022224_089520 [Nonomuraea antimicrobica]|uniref:Uncharacterized protein n=1 Tax=Nonomuraea antimicrobica TaxID=561173 RepID=A0ABP7DW76_9ACTN